MESKNIRCMYCKKNLGGFVFEHNCKNKANSKNMWDSKKILRKKDAELSS